MREGEDTGAPEGVACYAGNGWVGEVEDCVDELQYMRQHNSVE